MDRFLATWIFLTLLRYHKFCLVVLEYHIKYLQNENMLNADWKRFQQLINPNHGAFSVTAALKRLNLSVTPLPGIHLFFHLQRKWREKGVGLLFCIYAQK